MKIINVSNAAAFGMEIVCPDGRTQLVNIRGGHTLTLGMLPRGERSWLTTPIDNPERFGFTGPVRSVKEMQRIAVNFAQAATVYA